MRRAVEIMGCLGVSAAVHAGVVTGIGDGMGGPQGQGAGGASQVTLQAAPENLAALADRWSTAPRPDTVAPAALQAPQSSGETARLRPETAMQSLSPPDPPAAPNRDTAPSIRPGTTPPDWSDPAHSHVTPAAPQAPAAPATATLPTSRDTAPRRGAPGVLASPAAPDAPGIDSDVPPSAGSTALAAAQSPRPAQRPDRPNAQPAPPSAPQPARIASGTGAGPTQGAASAPATAQPALSAGERQSLMSTWGARIMARIERARPRVAGSGQVTLALRIARDGRLTGLSVARSSGTPEVDAAALSAVRRAGRFPAAPAGLDEASYAFSLPVRFR